MSECRKRLSVVIIGYNTSDAEWKRCVDSVKRNLSDDDEIICVDDCSSRPSSYLQTLSSVGSGLRVLRLEQNSGQAVARNRGSDLAAGEFVAFVDSDDVVTAGTYERALDALIANGADIAVYGVRTIWGKEGLQKENVLGARVCGRLNASDVDALREATLFNYPWNKVYRKDFLVAQGVRFAERAIPREDEVFNIDCVLRDARWVVIEHVGQIYYRQDGTSLARYRRHNRQANEAVNEAWNTLRTRLGGRNQKLKNVNIMDDAALAWSDWCNLWRRQSPIPFKERIDWARINRKQLARCDSAFARIIPWSIYAFVGSYALYVFLRRHCYWRMIRRWHIRRLNPQCYEFVETSVK